MIDERCGMQMLYYDEYMFEGGCIDMALHSLSHPPASFILGHPPPDHTAVDEPIENI